MPVLTMSSLPLRRGKPEYELAAATNTRAILQEPNRMLPSERRNPAANGRRSKRTMPLDHKNCLDRGDQDSSEGCIFRYFVCLLFILNYFCTDTSPFLCFQ